MEPNADYHVGLRRRIKEEGLEDVYVIIPVGVEGLGSKWVQRGEVDSIITVGFLAICISGPQDNYNPTFEA